MLLRSLALRDEAMALCDPAVDMLLWKLAPINDISTFGILDTAALALRRAVHKLDIYILVTPTPCAAA